MFGPTTPTLVIPILAIFATTACLAATEIHVDIDWSTPKVVTKTAATVEVDVMPFLGRTDYGGNPSPAAPVLSPPPSPNPDSIRGPFNAYYEALQNLGAEYVRYSPWFANPRVVVPELYPPDCTKEKPVRCAH